MVRCVCHLPKSTEKFLGEAGLHGSVDVDS